MNIDILKIYSFNTALMDKYISQYTEHFVFSLWRQNITPRDRMVKYFPPREGNTKNQLYQYNPIYLINCFSCILIIQWTDRAFLTTVARNDCHKSIIVRKPLFKCCWNALTQTKNIANFILSTPGPGPGPGWSFALREPSQIMQPSADPWNKLPSTSWHL